MSTNPATSSLRLLPMRPRDPGESGRTASALELFFDLVFVVAVSTASVELHHALTEDHVVDGTRVDARTPHQRGQRVGGQVGGVHAGQGSPAPADRGADGVDDVGLGHVRAFRWRSRRAGS